MIRSFAWRMAGWCLKHSQIAGDRDVIAYGLECKINDALQIIVLILIAILLRKPLEVICFCLCFVSLKRNVGGYHAPNHLLCVLGFSGLVILSVVLTAKIPLPASVFCAGILSAFTILIVFRHKPCPHANHPKSDRAIAVGHRMGKRISLCQLAVVSVSVVVFPTHSFWLAGALGGMIAALSLYMVSQYKADCQAENEGRENHEDH